MPRAFVLIKFPGDLQKGMDLLAEESSDPDFAVSTGTVIEACHYAFGAADYSAVLYAPAWGSISLGVRKIRERLDGLARQLKCEGQTVTSSIMGIGERDTQSPTAYAAALSSRFAALSKAAEAAKADGEEESDPNLLETISGELALEAYAKERLEFMRPLLKRLQKGKAVGDRAAAYAEFSGALEKILTQIP